MSLDHDFVNTDEERAELEHLTRIGVDITRPLEEQSKDAQVAYWLFVESFARTKIIDLTGLAF